MAAVGVEASVNNQTSSTAQSSSGGFDASLNSVVNAGMNVPLYPDFNSLNPQTSVISAVSSVSNNLIYYAFVAMAGVGIVWLLKK